jgi:hypothetical protein
MTARCLTCGATECRGHHVTGRDPDGRYLDPDLRPPYCHDHHELSHDDWRTLGIQNVARGQEAAPQLTLVERVELRLRRLAAAAARQAAAHPEHQWIAALARALKRWADELARDIAARDRRDAGWRSDPAFYPTEG